jgi:RNase P subunit RPR2
MRREYCPKCKTIKNLKRSVTKTTTKDKKGKIKETAINSYHCEECNSFIRSEEDKTRSESLDSLLLSLS